ncbi:MAG: hypothetical protein ACR2N3_18200 [Pyrinomonadaceae bacterium]
MIKSTVHFMKFSRNQIIGLLILLSVILLIALVRLAVYSNQ